MHLDAFEKVVPGELEKIWKETHREMQVLIITLSAFEWNQKKVEMHFFKNSVESTKQVPTLSQ